MLLKDFSNNQLSDYKKTVTESSRLVTSWGKPIDNITESLQAGPNSPSLLQDITYIDEITHFNRERIPERVVHAKGAGAFGYFVCTHDVTMYTKACVFSHIGKKTNVAVRFSTVIGESGSADTVRDIRGFAIKFYTEDGMWDLVGNNSPIFFIRDPIMFPNLVHSQKRNPVTHMRDANSGWDFQSLHPETIHQFMLLYSDRGIPDGYRYMNGYGGHTFRLVNAKGEAFWCKFHYKSDQGIKNLSNEKARYLAGTNPDYNIRDLYNAIAGGDYPSYTLCFQIMSMEQAEKFKFDIFDLTKVWSHKEFPLILVGKIVLNKNPSNYFNDVEQIAFAPSHLIPGVEPSPDKMLQGRLFAYADAHRHRLGTNYLQLPVNCPKYVDMSNYQRNGPQCLYSYEGAPNYFPNSFGGPEMVPEAKMHSFEVKGMVDRYSQQDDDVYEQPRDFYLKVLDEDARQRLIENIVSCLQNAEEFIQKKVIHNFGKVDMDFATRIAAGVQCCKQN